ncbi:hypothetical protein RHSIM_Rhsim01G0264100 [Rhododendron simsii]|uniref:Uncharacterized protein n=1 Tax=Rhododendron simsii TaxID=118357 RepID=A0A834HEC9_RHOSS|nr:hypothetical protein RHSIM_Rhsim01G0264100 [Rhododendron simsii]
MLSVLIGTPILHNVDLLSLSAVDTDTWPNHIYRTYILYMVVIFFLLLVETALITDISLNSHCEKDFPENPSGRFDDFDHFVQSNFDTCKWIGWLLVLAQVCEAALQVVKDEEAINQRQCEDLNNLACI